MSDEEKWIESKQPDYQTEDELIEQAVEIMRIENKGSIQVLQRRLRIGYLRAKKIMEQLEDRGVVGPAREDGMPRDVLFLN